MGGRYSSVYTQNYEIPVSDVNLAASKPSCEVPIESSLVIGLKVSIGPMDSPDSFYDRDVLLV